jgi:uncharacterized protein YcfL
MKRTFLVFLMLFALVGCAARMNRVMASWEGHNFNDLMASWGPPGQVFDDGSGGRVLVWTVTRSYTTPGSATTRTTGSATASGNTVWGSATSHTIYTPSQTHQWKAYRMFWVNQYGVIYRWAWRGM